MSYSIVRAVHFMRTTPLRQWRKQGEEFDSMVCEAAGRIVGRPFDVRTFSQAALTPKLGGLGLRKAIEHLLTVRRVSHSGARGVGQARAGR